MTLLNAEAMQMVRDMLISPDDFMKHPKRFANSFMMSVGQYSIKLAKRNNNDCRILMIEEQPMGFAHPTLG